jgi:hypothetical protein
VALLLEEAEEGVADLGGGEGRHGCRGRRHGSAGNRLR